MSGIDDWTWTPDLEARVRSALSFIPMIEYFEWLQIGMALHSTQWRIARSLWDEASRKCPQKFDETNQERKWSSFDRPHSGRKIALGTLFFIAKQHGWKDLHQPKPETSGRPTSAPGTAVHGETENNVEFGERNGGSASQDHRDQDSEQTRQEGEGANQNKSESSSKPFPLNWHGEQNAQIRRKWLVKNMIPETGVGLISGQWGTYKTFIAIDLAGAVMTGNSFAGRLGKRQGGVLFLAAEGAGEMQIRLCGLVEAKFSKRTGKLPFAWVDGCPKLTEKGTIDQLESIAKQAVDRMQSEFGVELVLIIVDTMSAAAGFTDENSSSEGQRAMNLLAELSRRTGAFVMACDHFGKAVETGTRGTSAKEAAADVVIACLADKTMAGNVTNTRIALRKLRGGATGAETSYARRIIDLGFDEDKEAITTCVIDWSSVTVSPPPQAAKGKGWPMTATVFRQALVTALKAHGKVVSPLAGEPPVLAVELDKIREEFDQRYPIDKDNDAKRKKQMDKRRQVFRRSRTDAEAKGLIGCRTIEENLIIWPVNPEDGALDGKSPH